MEHKLAISFEYEINKEKKEFENTIESIDRLVNKLESMSNALMKADEHAFFGKILNLFK